MIRDFVKHGGFILVGIVIGVFADFEFTKHPADAIGISVEDASMRDLFAGMAVTGLLANSSTNLTKEALAQKAYQISDAVLAARKAKK